MCKGGDFSPPFLIPRLISDFCVRDPTPLSVHGVVEIWTALWVTDPQACGGFLCDRIGRDSSSCSAHAYPLVKSVKYGGPPPWGSVVLPSGTSHTAGAPPRNCPGYASRLCRISCLCQGCARTGCTDHGSASRVPGRTACWSNVGSRDRHRVSLDFLAHPHLALGIQKALQGIPTRLGPFFFRKDSIL